MGAALGTEILMGVGEILSRTVIVFGPDDFRRFAIRQAVTGNKRVAKPIGSG